MYKVILLGTKRCFISIYFKVYVYYYVTLQSYDTTSLIYYLIQLLYFYLLRKQPQNVDEIGEANRKHEEFENSSPEMITMFENADKKNKILSAWSRENVEQVSKVTGELLFICLCLYQ